ncbi:hypothetical protein V8G54_022207 [Vigna mungo]|uniref:Uncharacterized protein n=1 Tax=Vigna mungo TaxID=3915 RepID=A0AAQ3NFL0_VIGMU
MGSYYFELNLDINTTILIPINEFLIYKLLHLNIIRETGMKKLKYQVIASTLGFLLGALYAILFFIVFRQFEFGVRISIISLSTVVLVMIVNWESTFHIYLRGFRNDFVLMTGIGIAM